MIRLENFFYNQNYKYYSSPYIYIKITNLKAVYFSLVYFSIFCVLIFILFFMVKLNKLSIKSYMDYAMAYAMSVL